MKWFLLFMGVVFAPFAAFACYMAGPAMYPLIAINAMMAVFFLFNAYEEFKREY